MCDFNSNNETFDTNAGADQVKIIALKVGAAWQNCHSGTDVGVGALTNTNLGPADGAAETTNKVCMQTSFVDMQALPGKTNFRKVWVEVAQGSGIPEQAVIRHSTTNMLGFQTRRSIISHWTINTGLRPNEIGGNLYSVTSGISTSVLGVTGTAGALTEINTAVSSSAVSAAPTGGFIFTLFSDATYGALSAAAASDKTFFGPANRFKLVATKRPTVRQPESSTLGTWGDVNTWASEGADCNSPGVDSATNIMANGAVASNCLNPGCPTVTTASSDVVTAKFHIPIDPGQFFVCYKSVGT
eukprot:gene8308-30565_t